MLLTSVIANWDGYWTGASDTAEKDSWVWLDGTPVGDFVWVEGVSGVGWVSGIGWGSGVR